MRTQALGRADRTAAGMRRILVAAGIAVALAAGGFLGPGPDTPRSHTAAAAASIGASHGDRDAASDLLFPPAIVETEIPLDGEPRSAGPAGISAGDDSLRLGHVAAGYGVDPGVLSANAADLCRLCRRLL